jgi:hypothetical protein
MVRTSDGCELVPGTAGRFASAGWFFFEDLQDVLDVDFFLERFDAVLDGRSAVVRTGGNMTTLEIRPSTSCLWTLGQRGPGAAIASAEFRQQLRRLRAFLSAGDR